MWKHLEQFGVKLPPTDWKKINQDILPVLRDIEQVGIKLDVPLIQALDQKLAVKITELEKLIYEAAGQEFNINSPSQMAEILFDKLKLPTQTLKRTKSGFSTAASELRKIEALHPVIKPILHYRELAKLSSTYLKPLPLLVDERSRLHTHFGQDTSTGRINSTEPNLQNIPIKGEWGGEIRKAFIADEGKVLISADYSQIELRVVACLAQDQAMLKAFEENKDVHTATAREIFNIKGEVSSQQRRFAKTINFGVLYGMSPYGLSQALGIEQTKAAEYIKKYFEVHSGIRAYCEMIIDQARTQGYVETLFGYTRTLPNISSPIHNLAEAEERMAINTPIQGTAAEILKLAMIELHQRLIELEKTGLEAKILLTIHDELIIETDKANGQKIAAVVKEVMEGVVTLCTPIEVEVEIGPNWSEMEKF